MLVNRTEPLCCPRVSFVPGMQLTDLLSPPSYFSQAAQLILESLGRMVSPQPPSIAQGGRYEEDGEQVCSSESTSREAPAPTSRAGSYYEVFYSLQYNFGARDNSESAMLHHLHFLDGNLVPVVGAEDVGVTPL